MRITCMIPSRRADYIIGCVHAFSMLESHEHEVTYAVGVDTDDPASMESTSRAMQRYRVSMHVFNRLPALGSYHNALAAGQPADVYTTLGDDVICAAQGWDSAIAAAVEENPRGIWWWSCSKEREAIYPIVTEQWRTAAGHIFTDLFPCWYDDVWLREVAIMVTGKEVPRIEGARLIDTPLPTTRMRDMLFWDDFFHACRPARLAEAQRIAEAMYPERTIEQMMQVLATFAPNEAYRAGIPDMEAVQGDRLPVTPSYLAAKQRAESIMEKIAEANKASLAAA